MFPNPYLQECSETNPAREKLKGGQRGGRPVGTTLDHHCDWVVPKSSSPSPISNMRSTVPTAVLSLSQVCEHPRQDPSLVLWSPLVLAKCPASALSFFTLLRRTHAFTREVVEYNVQGVRITL